MDRSSPAPASFRLGARSAIVGVVLLGLCRFAPGQDAPPERPATERAGEDQAGGLPSDAEMARLVTESLLSFDAALKARDFAAFHKALSKTFAGQKTPEQFLEIFQPFIDGGADLSGVKAEAPVLDLRPGWDGEVLILDGHFPKGPACPMRVKFNLRYVSEAGGWRLHGIKVNLRKGDGDASLPTNDQLRWLATRTVLGLGDAIKSGDFHAFHDGLAKSARDELSAEKLKERYHALIDQAPDLSTLRDVGPVFDEPATLNRDDVLDMKGRFPMAGGDAGTVAFQSRHLWEGGEWKLLNLVMDIKRPSKSETRPETTPETGGATGE